MLEPMAARGRMSGRGPQAQRSGRDERSEGYRRRAACARRRLLQKEGYQPFLMFSAISWARRALASKLYQAI